MEADSADPDAPWRRRRHDAGQLCQEAAKKAVNPAAVKVVVYPGALHAFDVPELPPRMRYGFATIGSHPQAAASALGEVEQFLRSVR